MKDNAMTGAGSILILGREPIIVDLLAKILTDAGYVAYTAPDDTSPLAAIAEHNPALLLLEIWSALARTVLSGSKQCAGPN